jgi:outer membrane protein OmpA-like peptidoglycan-associated protein
LQGETPYLRGTMGMINMAAEICNSNAMTSLVTIYQHSWSAGGDALVVKENIKQISDLKGKTIAIQKYGPHVDYLMKLLTDANLKVSDVNLVWTTDLVGPEGDTPMAKLYEQNVQAAFVIIPDALALTSSGTVGTGSEDSVKGARILLSTKTANRIISDVYAVRKDYFDSHRGEVEKFVKGLFKAEEEVKDLFKNKQSGQYQKLIAGAAQVLLDSAEATGDTEALYYDAELVGFSGNVKFFGDPNNPRNFANLTNEIQTSFMELGLLQQKSELLAANWNYDDLKSGLKYADAAEASRFNENEVATMITKRQQQDTLDEGSLFAFEIYFQPNQNTFTVDLYGEQFKKVVELASTYGGAIVTIEGHSDPMGYLRKQKEGESDVVLKQIAQAAKNLSFSRANNVRDEIIAFAGAQGITIDPAQFATIGHGIAKPKYPVPKTKQEWLDNMRVEFKVIQVEAEADVFIPLD